MPASSADALRQRASTGRAVVVVTHRPEAFGPATATFRIDMVGSKLRLTTIAMLLMVMLVPVTCALAADSVQSTYPADFDRVWAATEKALGARVGGSITPPGRSGCS